MTDTPHPHQEFDAQHLPADETLPGEATEPASAATPEDLVEQAEDRPTTGTGRLGRVSLRLGVGVSNIAAGLGERAAGVLAKRAEPRESSEDDAPRRRKLPAGVGAGLAFGAAGVAAYVAAKHGVDMLPKGAASHDVAQQALGHAPKGGHSELHAQLASYDSPLTPSKVPAAVEHLDFSKPIRPGEGPVDYLTRIGASPKEAHSLASNQGLMNSLIKSGDAYKAGKFNGHQVWGLNHLGKVHTGKDPAKNGQKILEDAHEHWRVQHGGKSQAVPQPGQGSGGKQQPELPRRGSPSDTATPQPRKATPTQTPGPKSSAPVTPTPTPKSTSSAAAGAPTPTQSTPHPSTTPTHSHSPTPSPSVTAPLGDSAKQASHGHTPIGDRIAYGLTGGFAGGVITGVSDIVGNTIKEKNIPEFETMTPEQKRALLVSTIGGMLLGGFAGGTASGELYLMTEAATGLIAGSAGYVLGKKPRRRKTYAIPLNGSTPSGAAGSGEGSRTPQLRLRRLRVPRGEPGAGITQQFRVAGPNLDPRLPNVLAIDDADIELPDVVTKDKNLMHSLRARFEDVGGLGAELAQLAARARIANRPDRSEGELADFYESVRTFLKLIGTPGGETNDKLYGALGILPVVQGHILGNLRSQDLRSVAEVLFNLIPPEMQEEDSLQDVVWLVDGRGLTPGEEARHIHLADALELVTHTQVGSPAMLENRLNISATEADELMGMLEVLQVVGPPDAAGEREVKLGAEESLRTIVDRLRSASA